MSHDNSRFDVSGDSQERLTAAINLYSMIHGHGSHRLEFVGYSIDPYIGMLLHQWEGNLNKRLFPFDEGKDPERLSAFFYNYLMSPLSSLKKLPEIIVGKKDDYSDFRNGIHWDDDHSHDGHNRKGWRLMTGGWGHVLSSATPLVIKPIFCWYGK